MTHSIAFHSYKGGTGKTTIASNLSAFLTNSGYSVCLLDFDVYSPSLHTYFDVTPKRWINDFIYHETDIEDILVEVTHKINNEGRNTNREKREIFRNINEKQNADGKLYVGLSSYKKEEIYKLEISGNNPKLQLFQKLLDFRERIIKKIRPDFIIIDTSPGIRFWSLNALALSDILFLTLKMGDIDMDGTKKMVSEIYNSFKRYGSKSFLVWNRIGGYCSPPLQSDEYLETINSNPGINPTCKTDFTDNNIGNFNNTTYEDTLSDEMGIKVISTIPCYCDIQFSRKEFLTSINQSFHPFSKEISDMAKALHHVLSADE